MNSTLLGHMEKMAKYRLTGKTVQIDIVTGSIGEVAGFVSFENDKGIFVDTTESDQTVFVPWTSIAVLRILND
jgi:hypothetical protein